MGDTITKYFEMYEGFDEALLEEKDIEAIKEMRKQYPEINKEFQKIQLEQYSLFCKKMLDYGIGNIALGGNLENKKDRNYSLTGIQIRLNDKINRLKNLLIHKNNYVEGESIEDTFIDISTYGMIAMIVGRKKWK
jgi:hypothetical protein